MTKQSARTLEQHEAEGDTTLKSLREAANALDLQLVYGILTKDCTFEALIERKARELAIQIVQRTSATMRLEGQVAFKRLHHLQIFGTPQNLKLSMDFSTGLDWPKL